MADRSPKGQGSYRRLVYNYDPETVDISKVIQLGAVAYFVGNVGGATLDTVRAYVESQGTQERTRKGTG